MWGEKKATLKKQWEYKIRCLRQKWTKINRSHKSAPSENAFYCYLQVKFYESDSVVPAGQTEDAPESSDKKNDTTISLQSAAAHQAALTKPFDELSPRQSRRRTDTIMSLLREEAEEQKISTTQLLGYMMLHRENYVHNRVIAGIGMKLFHEQLVSKELSIDEALHILSTYKLGRIGYTTLRRDLKQG